MSRTLTESGWKAAQRDFLNAYDGSSAQECMEINGWTVDVCPVGDSLSVYCESTQFGDARIVVQRNAASGEIRMDVAFPNPGLVGHADLAKFRAYSTAINDIVREVAAAFGMFGIGL